MPACALLSQACVLLPPLALSALLFEAASLERRGDRQEGGARSHV